MLAILNGAFYFLTDVADKKPPELPYNLCIRDYKIRGLPSSDQPIAYIQNGILKTYEPKATGLIEINGKKVIWKGARSDSKLSTDAILYNSRCCTIRRFREPEKNIQIGVLDSDNIYTPKGQDVFDVIVGIDISGNLRVIKIQKGGNTHFFNGAFILQFKNCKINFRVGDIVKTLTLDGLDLYQLSSAISIGKSLNNISAHNCDLTDKRDARSVIAKDRAGNIHFIVFDGSKYIPGFSGVSSKEITGMFSKFTFEWVYFLDGGGSSRLIVRNENQLQICANEFAFRKMSKGLFLWDWEKARTVASSISLRIKVKKRIAKES